MFLENKRKILFVSEASFASTGFGNIYKELISRFHASKKFRVAEFATDAFVGDDRAANIPWRFYPNSVYSSDSRSKTYKSSSNNKFGKWRFEAVLNDFEPDIVIDLRDPPFFHFESMSPLRENFYWCIAPTVDSAPQPPDWVSMFLGADAVMPYTDFGYKTLKEEHPDIKAHNGFGPGINLRDFSPRDQKEARTKLNIETDAKIIGFVSRNQVRKRFPELLKAFSDFISRSDDTTTLLHLHTATPDIETWNISGLLIEHGLSDRVLFTYMCHECSDVSMKPWQGSTTHCSKCQKRTCIHPRSGLGCTREDMATIYNSYDFYVQYSNCEGLGVGILEAAASGVPVATVNYSAMQSLNEKLGLIKIPYVLSRDIKTDADRAIPDHESMVQILMDHMVLSKGELATIGKKTRLLCEQHFDWDKIAEKWINFCDNADISNNIPWGERSEAEPEFFLKSSRIKDMQQLFQDEDRQDIAYSYYLLKVHEHNDADKLNVGGTSLSDEEFLTLAKNFGIERKHWIDINHGKKETEHEDFISYADQKEIAGLNV